MLVRLWTLYDPTEPPSPYKPNHLKVYKKGN